MTDHHLRGERRRLSKIGNGEKVDAKSTEKATISGEIGAELTPV